MNARGVDALTAAVVAGVRPIRHKHSDGGNGRCVMGVLFESWAQEFAIPLRVGSRGMLHPVETMDVVAERLGVESTKGAIEGHLYGHFAIDREQGLAMITANNRGASFKTQIKRYGPPVAKAPRKARTRRAVVAVVPPVAMVQA